MSETLDLAKELIRRRSVTPEDAGCQRLLAERLKPAELIGLVNSHAEVCTNQIDTHGGEVNKLLGDGVLAYFSERDSDTAIRASVEILQEMQRRRTCSKRNSPHKLLFGGVGLANGMVYDYSWNHPAGHYLAIYNHVSVW